MNILGRVNFITSEVAIMNGIKTVIFGACAYLNFTRETAVGGVY